MFLTLRGEALLSYRDDASSPATTLGNTLRLRTLTILLATILCAAPAHAQKKQNQAPVQSQQDDEQLLNVAENARDQVDSFVDAREDELRLRPGDKPQGKVDAFLRQIELDRSSEKYWEKTVWTIPNSELLPGEHIDKHFGTWLMIEGTGLTMRQRFPDCVAKKECFSASQRADSDEALYPVSAPLDIKARVLMEGLRHGISQYMAFRNFDGESPDDSLVTVWNSVWFDARNVYCRRSPGAKYLDLSSEEQVCK